MSADKEWDGIRSADNKMPGWYVYSFIGTVIFAIGYYAYFHAMTDWSTLKAYEARVEAHQAKYGSDEMPSTGPNPLAGDEAAIANGEKQFKAVCAACHGQDMKGLVGPDLTDKEWFHAGDDSVMTHTEAFDVVAAGRNSDPDPANKRGTMPGHSHLGNRAIWEILAYLESKNGNLQPGS